MQKLIEALAKFQSKITNVPFDGVNPHFKNKYATLAGITDHIRKPLAENNLCYTQLVNRDSVKTILMHNSGEQVEAETSILCSQPNNPQSYGSAVTYARRYALLGILGLVGDEDDDAQAATAQPKTQANTITPPTQNKPVPAAPATQQAQADVTIKHPCGHPLEQFKLHWKKQPTILGAIDSHSLEWIADKSAMSPEIKDAAAELLAARIANERPKETVTSAASYFDAMGQEVPLPEEPNLPFDK